MMPLGYLWQLEEVEMSNVRAEDSLCLRAAQDILERRFPQAMDFTAQERILRVAAIRIMSVAKDAQQLAMDGFHAESKKLSEEYARLKNIADEHAARLGIQLQYPSIN